MIFVNTVLQPFHFNSGAIPHNHIISPFFPHSIHVGQHTRVTASTYARYFCIPVKTRFICKEVCVYTTSTKCKIVMLKSCRKNWCKPLLVRESSSSSSDDITSIAIRTSCFMSSPMFFNLSSLCSKRVTLFCSGVLVKRCISDKDLSER